jgi:formamidopyrimidine-DNA glycosylase
MPELPEVETTRLGITEHITGHKITDIIIRRPNLRWPIPSNLKKVLVGKKLLSVTRRAKYLLLTFKTGTLILHLGMSGKLRVLTPDHAVQKHDHVDLCFGKKRCLRFTDPRRFGAILWTSEDPALHPLLVNLGPEPLTNSFNPNYLFGITSHRSTAIKLLIMDNKIVTGVGNIYATEALFQAGIHPHRPSNKVTLAECEKLVGAVKVILQQAIRKGGTTLRDFTNSDGSPGYFRIELAAYGRAGEPCATCSSTLELSRLGQRATVYCPECQK